MFALGEVPIPPIQGNQYQSPPVSSRRHRRSKKTCVLKSHIQKPNADFDMLSTLTRQSSMKQVKKRVKSQSAIKKSMSSSVFTSLEKPKPTLQQSAKSITSQRQKPSVKKVIKQADHTI
jgi:hypothetical protein